MGKGCGVKNSILKNCSVENRAACAKSDMLLVMLRIIANILYVPLIFPCGRYRFSS
jgi:hypothetical protein